MPDPDFRAALWIKSRRSEPSQQCMELATADGWIGVRDSKLGVASPILTFTPTAMEAFLARLE